MPILFLLTVIVSPDVATDVPGLLTRCFTDERLACQAFEYWAVRNHNAVLSRLNAQRGELDTWLSNTWEPAPFEPASSEAA